MRATALPKRILPNDVRFSPYAFGRLVRRIERSLEARPSSFVKNGPKWEWRPSYSSKERQLTALVRATRISREAVLNHFAARAA